MTARKVGQISLAILLFALAGQAQAWGCLPLVGMILYDNDNPLTEEQVLRHRSKDIADYLRNTLQGDDVVVVGQFFRNTDLPFLHEDQLEGIRALYSSRSEDVQMPYLTEYAYIGAYRFEGHSLIDAGLVPYSGNSIDAHVSISADYGGIVDQLPITGVDIIGVIRVGSNLEVTTSYCPSYFQIENSQVSDLLTCYEEAECY